MRILNTPISSVVLHISSYDSFYQGDSLFFELNLETPIICPPGYAMLLSLYSAEVPFSFYICNKYNNTLVLTENGVKRTITIPEGNYTPNSLKNKLTSLLGANYTITYNNDEMHYRFMTTLNNVSFNFSEGTCDQLLGFPNIDIDFENKQLISSQTINFTYTNSLFLVSDFTDVGSIDSQTRKYSSILAKIPINTNAGGMIYYSGHQNPHKILYQSSIIQRIRYKITDDRQRSVNLNGNYFNFSLLIDFVELAPRLPQLEELGMPKQI